MLPPGEDWVFKGHLCYRQPAGRLLEGLLAENSSFSTKAWVRRVTVPLFAPKEMLVLTYSPRIRARTFAPTDLEELRVHIEPILRGRESHHEALGRIVQVAVEAPRNWPLSEPGGYAAILLGGDTSTARALLERVANAPGMPDNLDETTRRSYPEPTAEELARDEATRQRARLILSLLERSVDDAIAQLDSWCQHTADALGIHRQPY